MKLEKSQTAQHIIEKISATASKVGFISDTVLSNALLQIENVGIPNNKHEDYKYCNIDSILKKEFKNIEQNFINVPINIMIDAVKKSIDSEEAVCLSCWRNIDGSLPLICVLPVAMGVIPYCYYYIYRENKKAPVPRGFFN